MDLDDIELLIEERGFYSILLDFELSELDVLIALDELGMINLEFYYEDEE